MKQNSFGGNAGGSNVLQRLTTQSTGNATDFGDPTVNLDGPQVSQTQQKEFLQGH